MKPGEPYPWARYIVAVSLTLTLAMGVVWWVQTSSPPTLSSKPETQESIAYVGRTVCRSCHQYEDALWTGSHHDLAMQEASNATVLGDFANRIVFSDHLKTTFFHRDGKFMVRTEGPDGDLHEYEIRYTFGVYPLQQYLIPFSGGRLQAFSIAWDTRSKEQGGQRWFHLSADDPPRHTDELHWTGIRQNWNSMCAECHSTNVQKHYDPANRQFATTWSDIDVSCEACHGPGTQHVKWAKQTRDDQKRDGEKGLPVRLNERTGIQWMMNADTGRPFRSVPRTTRREVETCALCHARRDPLFNEAKPGQPLLATHLPALLDEGLYHVDGQINDEVYEYGSFLQSKMFHAGVTCSDCHEPHALTLRASGNNLCLQCHGRQQYDTSRHHFHQPTAGGGTCVGCHMPARTYMVINPRHDHSLRVPQPAVSVQLGAPNACTTCHRDQSAAWAAQHVRNWYGHDPQGMQGFAEALNAGRKGTVEAESLLVQLANDRTQPSIARATGLALLGRFLSLSSMDAVQKGLDDSDPWLRLGALRALERLDPQRRYGFAARLLRDPLLGIRAEAGRLLAAVPEAGLSIEERAARQAGVKEYLLIQQANADQPEAQVNVGDAYRALGDASEGERAYREALALQPSFAPAYVNLADLYRSLGRDHEGESLLRDGLRRVATPAPLHHALGLLLARDKRLPEAVKALSQAAELMPQVGRYSYVYAIALKETSGVKAAIRVLEEARRHAPADRDILIALTQYNREVGRVAEARSAAQDLLKVAPTDAVARQLIESLED